MCVHFMILTNECYWNLRYLSLSLRVCVCVCCGKPTLIICCYVTCVMCVKVNVCVHEMKAIQWQTNNFLAPTQFLLFLLLLSFLLSHSLSLSRLSFLFLFINLLFIQPLSFSHFPFFLLQKPIQIPNWFTQLFQSVFAILLLCVVRVCVCVFLRLTPFHQKINWIDLHSSSTFLPFSIWLII